MDIAKNLIALLDAKFSGGMIKFQATTDYEHEVARTMVNTTLKANAPDGRFSLMKLADWQYQMVLVKGRGDADFDASWIKEKTEMLKKLLIESKFSDKNF